MKYHDFTNQYTLKQLTVEHCEAIYQLCATNPEYYEYLGEPLTKEEIIAGIRAVPPGKELEDKYFLGFYNQAKQLVAILDLVWQYPDVETAYVGLFMTLKAYQRHNISTTIIEGMLDSLRKQGMKKVRLGCIEANLPAQNFWQKNRFYDTGERKTFPNFQALIFERQL